MIRLLTFTSLYPSLSRPRHGIFVEQRLRRLVESGKVDARVVVPVPHHPLSGDAETARVERFGIAIRYVPFPALRALTTFVNPVLMALAGRNAIRDFQQQSGDFDVIDAHFLYPDGVAATLLGAWLGKPVVITARGSDVNVAAQEHIAGACIRWAARRVAALITVSEALRLKLIESGVAASRIAVLRNGVDLETFRPSDRMQARQKLQLSGRILLSVGNLVPEKGHELVLEALTRLPSARLLVIGSGPEKGRLQQFANALKVAQRVSWIEYVHQESLPEYYSAADVTVLASTREGMPNVLLESLACGTPVVATAVGGSVEVVRAVEAGRLVSSRSAVELAAACEALLESTPDPTATRRYAESFDWSGPINRQIALLESVCPNPRSIGA